MTIETFPCPTCGGPNKSVPGAKQMSCEYCGANLIIPESLQTAAKPRAEIKPPQERPGPSLEKDAPDLLRKAQPIAVKAWNAYALWTWIRRFWPACLTLIAIGILACLLAALIPVFWLASQ